MKQNCGILLRRAAATRSFFQTKQARTPTAQKNKIFPTNSNNFFIEIHYKRTRFFQQPFYKKFFTTSQEFCLNDIDLKRMCSIQTVEAALSTLSIHYQFMAYTHFLSIHQSTNQHIFINQSILMYNTKNDSLAQIYDSSYLFICRNSKKFSRQRGIIFVLILKCVDSNRYTKNQLSSY